MRNSIKQLALTLASVLFCLALTCVAASAQIMSGGSYKITSSVQASGGGKSTGSGNKVIEGTAGQTGAGGPLSKSSIAHVAGFWPTTLAANTATPTPTPSPTPTATPTPTVITSG